MIARFRSVLLLVACLVSCITMFDLQAQSLPAGARPKARVEGNVDRRSMRALSGTHPAVVEEAKIGPRIDSSTQLSHMVLVLEPSDEQKAALASLLDSQQDKSSPNYHKWLTPETYGQSFGVAASDISRVTTWLGDSGMQVESVSKSGRFVTFSGTAGAVEAAFHTEMHHLTVDGEAHVSNIMDISVPTVLAPVIRGIARLNNFAPKPASSDWKKVSVPVTADANGKPLFGSSPTGTHYVAPGDVAKIYNAKPLTDAGIDGTGVSISVIAQSNIQIADVQSFRSLFGLPKNDPSIIVIGSDPGENADDLEAFLDAEMAGSLATGAHVNFVVSGSYVINNSIYGGINLSGLYIVDNNLGDIITMSYGGCEKTNGSTNSAFWNILWEEAAAQGQTAFVSSGDSGASGCTSSSATNAGTNGYGVNALGSSNYNVSVGGTMFVDYGPSAYWGAATGIPYTSALGYIPEAALNQGSLSTTYLNSASTATQPGSGVFAGGGGISVFNKRPAWQIGSGISPASDPAATSGTGLPPGTVSGSVAAPHRLVPDVSFISAYGHDGTLMCGEGYCNETPSGGLGNAIVIGGTSVAAPAMASVQALINAANGGGRQGNVNYQYYALAAQQYASSSTACQSVNGTQANPTVTLPASTCNFNDVISGSISVASSGGAAIGFNAGNGYDAATGLGSPNIANLAHNWSSANFRSTTTTLSLSPTTSTHGASQTALIQVTSPSGGTPTGDVSFTFSDPTVGGAQGFFTLTNGAVNGNIQTLPGGTYNVSAHYGGDGVYAASDSAPVAVTIAAETSAVTFATRFVTTGGGVGAIAGAPYGIGQYDITARVAGASGKGAPFGNLTFSVVRDAITQPSLTGALDSNSVAALLAGPSVPAYRLASNYPMLTPGNYTITANYAGNSSFNASSNVLTFTVTKATPTVSYTAGTATVVSASPATLNYTITTPSGATPATGTVSFSENSNSLGSITLANGTGTFTTSALTATGTHSIAAVYSGDSNYAGANSSVNVVVTPGTPTTTTLTASASPVAASPVTLTATVSPNPSASTPVSFYDGGVLLGRSNASAATGVATLSTTALAGGTHNLTAVYAGTVSQSTSTGSLTLSVAKQATTITIGGGESATYGQSISLNGTIYRTGITPTGTAPTVGLTGVVNFYEGSTSGALLGTAIPIFGPAFYADPYVATLNISTLSAGSHTIVAAYTGDSFYGASVSTSAPVTINKLSQTITFTGLPANATYGSAGPYTLVATDSANLPISFSVTGPATISGTMLTITGAGTVVVTASQAGDATHAAATPVSQTIIVAKANQTITFTGLPANATYGSAGPYTLNGTASSGLAVSYSVSGPGSISGNTLTITGPGTVVVTASQPGDTNYNAAAPVSQTIVVAKTNQTITFTGLPMNATYGSAGPYTLGGSASSGLPVSYSVSGPASLSGNTLTITGPSTVVVTASQAGNATYAAATPVSQTIVVAKANQTITFTGLPANATYGSAGPYTLNGTASSGLAVSYSLSGPASLSGNTLTITGAGTVVVTASQTGNANYNAATPVSQTIVVSAPPTGGSATLTPSASVVRQSNGSYTVTVHVSNGSNATAANVVLTSVTLGAASGTPVPQSLGTLSPGGSANAVVTVPSSAGASGSVVAVRYTGTYTGGSFTGTARVTLP